MAAVLAKRSRSRSNRTILSEESFVSALEHIISRDYYPNTAALQADLRRLGHSRVSSQPASTRRDTPRTSGEDDGQAQSLPDLDNLGLNEFFSTYTSEDNASFENLLADDTENRRKRYHWTHPLMIKDHEEGESAGGEVQSAEKEKYREGMLMLYYLKEGTVLTAAERQDMDLVLASGGSSSQETGKEGVRSSAARYSILTEPQNFQVRNTMFFPPEGVSGSSRSAAKKGDVRCGRSAASDRAGKVATHNTRLPDFERELELQRGRPASFVIERPHSPTVYSDSMSRSESSAHRGGEQYPLLEMSPPRTPHFEMQPRSRRDQLALSLADSASAGSKHSSKRRRGGSQTTAALASSARCRSGEPRGGRFPSTSTVTGASKSSSFAAALQKSYSRK